MSEQRNRVLSICPKALRCSSLELLWRDESSVHSWVSKETQSAWLRVGKVCFPDPSLWPACISVSSIENESFNQPVMGLNQNADGTPCFFTSFTSTGHAKGPSLLALGSSQSQTTRSQLFKTLNAFSDVSITGITLCTFEIKNGFLFFFLKYPESVGNNCSKEVPLPEREIHLYNFTFKRSV